MFWNYWFLDKQENDIIIIIFFNASDVNSLYGTTGGCDKEYNLQCS